MAKKPRGKPDFDAVVEAGAPNVAYSAADLQQLAQAIGPVAAEIAERLEQAAHSYLFAALVERDPSRVAVVTFDRPMPDDVDTPEDYARLRRHEGPV